MSYLLNVLYLTLLFAASPWLLWQCWRKGKYREGFAEKLLGRVPMREGDGPCMWLHAVSVGEVNLLGPLIEALRRDAPQLEFVISTTTMTGYALAKKTYADHLVFYCPLDFSWAVRTAMRRIRPDVLVLAELELWPNLIRAAKIHGAKVAVVNGRLSERSYRGYRRLRPLIGRLLRCIDLLAVQNACYAERFERLGASPGSLHVTGSLKFDGAETDRHNRASERLRTWAGFRPGDVVFLAGSTQEPEEALALETFRLLRDEFPQLRLVLVPRHPDRFEAVADLLRESGLPWRRRSTCATAGLSSSEFGTAGQASSGTRQTTPAILLVDTIGELSAWWGTASIAYVGGSMGRRGGQNMIEPAAYGAAVCFGPQTANFRDVVRALLAAEAAVVVHDGRELTAFVRRMITSPAIATQMGHRAQSLVQSQKGATQATATLFAEEMFGLGRQKAA
ncbi:MAG: 3-deoxy-D-manno-octulosonic acid transferase [Planctomycetes bacterium]|nr:3-deoxy-D-manno-octulosonic acid transferase [Planctomycetota bacterium]